MNRADRNIGRVVMGFAAICFSGVFLALPADCSADIPHGFDSDGEKIFNRYNETPLAAMTGTDGRRNLEFVLRIASISRFSAASSP